MAADERQGIDFGSNVFIAKLLIIVLAALVFWHAATGLNAALHERGLKSSEPFLQAVSKLLTGGRPPFEGRLVAFWKEYHRPLAAAAFLVAVLALLARWLVTGRAIEFLFLESEDCDRRSYTGYVANLLTMLFQGGAIYAAISFATRGKPSLTPIALLALFAAGILWSGGTLLFASKEERRPMLGLWCLGASSLVASGALFAAVWAVEKRAFANEATRGSAILLVSAGVSIVLCLADAYIQSRIYGRRRSGPALLA